MLTVSIVVQAGRLLGLPKGELSEQFVHQILHRRVKAGSGFGVSRSRRVTEYQTACTVSQAREQRDCLVKALYSSLFSHVVQMINTRLGFPAELADYSELGILDLFGFERFVENGFEQFCINYANERLHQNFMRTAVNGVRENLLSEGVLHDGGQDATATTHALRNCDNSSVLGTIRTCANLLEEVCLLNRLQEPNGNRSLAFSENVDPRELAWIERLRSQCTQDATLTVSMHDLLTVKRQAKRYGISGKSTSNNDYPPSSLSPSTERCTSNCFTVRHFAGPVNYSVTGFVSKNLDRLPVHILQWLVDNISSPAAPNNPACGAQLPANSGLIHAVLVASAGLSSDRSMSDSPCSFRSPLKPINSPPFLGSTVNDSVKKPIFPSSKQVRMRQLCSPSRRVNTVFGNFKSAVDALLMKLDTHHLSFVRCLRPDRLPDHEHSGSIRLPLATELSAPSVVGSCCSVDRDRLKDQLASGGLLAAVRVLRLAYANSYTYDEFVKKYRALLRLCPTDTSNCLTSASPSLFFPWLKELIGEPPDSSLQKLRLIYGKNGNMQAKQVTLFLLVLGLHIVPDAACRTKGDQRRKLSTLLGQFGSTRIFLTDAQNEDLERLLTATRYSAAKIIQRAYRSFRRRFLSARTIQLWWRSRVSRRCISAPHPCPERATATDPNQPPPSPSIFSTEQTQTLESTPTANSSSFATCELHIVSRHTIPTSELAQCETNRQHFWNNTRLRQLHRLIPYIWRDPLSSITDSSTKGLLDVMNWQA
ncbi:unnamed protein product [Dicrocoelium dendriticum]|nr:unnamed protein product [Dicrocoelium dendriticum]